MRSQIGCAQEGRIKNRMLAITILQMFAARFLVPANSAVARLDTPRRGAEGQSAQPLPRAAAKQITNLRSAQRLCAQIVILVHQLVPDLREGTVGTVDPHQTDRLQGLQGGRDRGGLQSQRLASNPSRSRNRALIDLRQLQETAAMQLQQRHPATNFFELAQSRAPQFSRWQTSRERTPRGTAGSSSMAC